VSKTSRIILRNNAARIAFVAHKVSPKTNMGKPSVSKKKAASFWLAADSLN
jgi:hypothetical protein